VSRSADIEVLGRAIPDRDARRRLRSGALEGDRKLGRRRSRIKAIQDEVPDHRVGEPAGVAFVLEREAAGSDVRAMQRNGCGGVRYCRQGENYCYCNECRKGASLVTMNDRLSQLTLSWLSPPC
jgi:hypothetical protein